MLEQTDIEGSDLTAKQKPPPGTMSVQLYEHQEIGLAWMLERESGNTNPIGGILGDDQVSMRMSGSRVLFNMMGCNFLTKWYYYIKCVG